MAVPKTKWKNAELIEQIEKLETKINALITAYNAHVHVSSAATVSTVTALDLSA